MRLNGPKAASKKIALNITFTDPKRNYSLVVENGAADKAIEAGELKVSGKREALTELVGMLDTFPFWFNIVTP